MSRSPLAVSPINFPKINTSCRFQRNTINPHRQRTQALNPCNPPNQLNTMILIHKHHPLRHQAHNDQSAPMQQNLHFLTSKLSSRVPRKPQPPKKVSTTHKPTFLLRRQIYLTLIMVNNSHNNSIQTSSPTKTPNIHMNPISALYQIPKAIHLPNDSQPQLIKINKTPSSLVQNKLNPNKWPVSCNSIAYSGI